MAGSGQPPVAGNMKTSRQMAEELEKGLHAALLDFVREALLSWWRAHGLEYPWRSYRDPWEVLVSEILLRKTNAEKVSSRIGEVLSVLRSPEDVLRLREEDLADLLRPFGMQRIKARQLRGLAQRLAAEGGRIPEDPEALSALPGVGRYIAAAVLCFALGRPAAAVDTNVIRVLTRVFGVKPERSRPRADPYIWKIAELLLPADHPREHSWALLDLGKKVCRPRRPKCSECPLAAVCWWNARRAEGTAGRE
jgi:A/G-specific adenine glycosylase